jgi:hypothetical protein
MGTSVLQLDRELVAQATATCSVHAVFVNGKLVPAGKQYRLEAWFDRCEHALHWQRHGIRADHVRGVSNAKGKHETTVLERNNVLFVMSGTS